MEHWGYYLFTWDGGLSLGFHKKQTFSKELKKNFSTSSSPAPASPLDDSKMVYQIRTSWNTLVPYMEEIAAVTQQRVVLANNRPKAGEKQLVAAAGVAT